MSWSLLTPDALLGPFLFAFSASDQRHQHRAEREFADLGLSGEFAQVPAGARNRRAPLQDRRDAKEIAPVRNTALGVVGNVRAGREDHSKRIGLLWRSRGFRWWLGLRPLAFSEARFRFNGVVWV